MKCKKFIMGFITINLMMIISGCNSSSSDSGSIVNYVDEPSKKMSSDSTMIVDDEGPAFIFDDSKNLVLQEGRDGFDVEHRLVFSRLKENGQKEEAEIKFHHIDMAPNLRKALEYTGKDIKPLLKQAIFAHLSIPIATTEESHLHSLYDLADKSRGYQNLKGEWVAYCNKTDEPGTYILDCNFPSGIGGIMYPTHVTLEMETDSENPIFKTNNGLVYEATQFLQDVTITLPQGKILKFPIMEVLYHSGLGFISIKPISGQGYEGYSYEWSWSADDNAPL